jgi:hypothetical protein
MIEKFPETNIQLTFQKIESPRLLGNLLHT